MVAVKILVWKKKTNKQEFSSSPQTHSNISLAMERSIFVGVFEFRRGYDKDAVPLSTHNMVLCHGEFISTEMYIKIRSIFYRMYLAGILLGKIKLADAASARLVRVE